MLDEFALDFLIYCPVWMCEAVTYEIVFLPLKIGESAQKIKPAL